MISLPKPARRGPKPPKAIPRRSVRGHKRPNPFAGHHELQKLCDDTFSLIVRLRERNRCRLCSRRETQCAHLISRRYRQPRWSLDNAWALCPSCHKRWTEDPLGWDDLMERMFGPVEWARRKAAARIPCKPDLSVIRFALYRLLEVTIKDARGAYRLAERIEAVNRRHSPYERRT